MTYTKEQLFNLSTNWQNEENDIVWFRKKELIKRIDMLISKSVSEVTQQEFYPKSTPENWFREGNVAAVTIKIVIIADVGGQY